MSLLFRKIPKRLIRVDIENYRDFNKPLDDISSAPLSDINCWIMQQPSTHELIVMLQDLTTDDQMYKVFTDLGMKAKITERKIGYKYQYGLPKFHTSVYKGS